MQDSKSFSLVPANFSEAKEFATLISKSELVPKDYRDKPFNVLCAIQMGMELGIQPMQALQGIAVINGRPSVWGDAMLALVRGSDLCEGLAETIAGEGEKMVATCTIKRKGEKTEIVRRFSVDDAKKAKLWGKEGPWTNYPTRMLQMRARAWACRDAFPDVLKGIAMAEEIQDVPKDLGAAEVVSRGIEMPQPIKTVDNDPPIAGPGDDHPSLMSDPVPVDEPPMPEAMAGSPVAAPEGNPIVPGAIKIVAMKLAAAGKSEKDLAEKFGVAEVKDLRQNQVNAVLDWLKAKNG